MAQITKGSTLIMDQCAIAVFVKTPGLSPLKTRLAAGIGQSLAEEFYKRAAQATVELVEAWRNQRGSWKAFWAVAEPEALDLPIWSSWPTLRQGQGGLGDRLYHVTSELKKDFDRVFLLGNDSPHINLEHLQRSEELLAYNDCSYVISPTEDGGFYLFGTKTEIAQGLWQSVPYSSSHTAEVLRQKLSALGPVSVGPSSFDVDHLDDLYKLLNEPVELRAQRDLSQWVRTIVP